MVWWWLVQLVISLVLFVISIALTPRPKKQKPQAAKDLEGPTSEAGRPIPVVFGTITVQSANVMWTGEKNVVQYKVRA